MLIIRTSFAFYLTEEMKFNEQRRERETGVGGGGEDGMWRKGKAGNAKSEIVKNLFS